jgi:hypothetical protein
MSDRLDEREGWSVLIAAVLTDGVIKTRAM